MPEPVAAEQVSQGGTLRAKVLAQAGAAIHGDRNVHYGTPIENFERIAWFWTTYLGKDIRPSDVANMMILLKIARGMNLPTEDTYVDIAGYAACGWECFNAEDPF